MNDVVFTDRRHAGHMLAGALGSYAELPDGIVLGLPRGGVPVAYEIATQLHLPLDVMVVRKLGVPGWEELAMGAVASGAIRVINERVVRDSGIAPEVIERVVAGELDELHQREIAFRGHRGAPDVKGKTVILVDDGIATGSTIRAAVQALHMQEPARIVIAVPVAAPDACDNLEPLVDELVVLRRPIGFHAVSRWYEDFRQTPDSDVKRLLDDARRLEAARRN